MVSQLLYRLLHRIPFLWHFLYSFSKGKYNIKGCKMAIHTMSTSNYFKILYLKIRFPASVEKFEPWISRSNNRLPSVDRPCALKLLTDTTHSWIIRSFTFPVWLSRTVLPLSVFLVTVPCFTQVAIYLSSVLFVSFAGFLWPRFLAHVPALWVWSNLGPTSSHSGLKPIR